MSSAVVEDDPMPQDWGEFLEGINFNEKIYKIVAMVNEKGRGKEYLVWWEDKPFEESTWIPITHLKKFYTEEALLKINEFKSKEAFKARLESASKLGKEEKWKFLKNARPNDTKAYNPRIFDDEQMVIDSDDGLGKMPELNYEEIETLKGIKGNWGGRKSRKKKRKTRKKRRKTRKKRRKTRKKKRKKMRRTRKKKRR
tara:strand:+ start:1801 stop:2394 length:594 start_codon:yes stop_codon:yes gene_type:complete